MITYIATNTKTGKFYIGSTKNFERRKSQHLKRKVKWPFQSSLRKNPEDFIWHVVEDSLDEPRFEQILLDMYFGTELCYNLSPKADRPPGFKGGRHTEEFKRSITGEKSPLFGVPKTQEHKKKISVANSGENHPHYGRTGEKHPLFGVPQTEAQKKAQSEKMSGEKNPQYGRTGALHHNSKAIIAIKPDGTELHFGGVNEAARELGIGSGALSGRYLKTGHSPTKGKFKGWRFAYENP